MTKRARPTTSRPAEPREERSSVVLGRGSLRVEDVLAVAAGRARVELDADSRVRARLDASHAAVERLRRSGNPLYGVTTGVGASVANAIPEELHAELPLNLVRFHGCGTGRLLDDEEAAAVLVARAASLAQGYSGVRPVLVERLCELASRRILPCIPAEGSVGASGDLTPLSYVASLLVGEREARVDGAVVPAAEALARAGLAPLALEPKESLAIMNGTSVMTGLACIAFGRAQQLARAACAITAVASDATRGNPAHFDARIGIAKPHPGQQLAARWIREDLAPDPAVASTRPAPARVQDRYSIRCAPQVVGVLLDALRFARELVETELCGANDNPLIDPDTGDALHGGNFYGGHVGFAMDALKAAVASVADLLDRQLVLLCTPETSGGLPENLVARTGPDRVVHHGFKAMQITASALTAEALKLTAPASAFSRSTESHNQDKVSMGSIAVRECLRILELTETVAAIALLAVVQAVDLRGAEAVAVRSRDLQRALRKAVEPNTADRRQDRDIETVLALLRRGELPVGDPADSGELAVRR
ncbi:MAG: aromatic amino acid lyase [Myxococcales bacterium]|nr:aromatic amino acid lyase [Myxococcales bacterium]